MTKKKLRSQTKVLYYALFKFNSVSWGPASPFLYPRNQPVLVPREIQRQERGAEWSWSFFHFMRFIRSRQTGPAYLYPTTVRVSLTTFFCYLPRLFYFVYHITTGYNTRPHPHPHPNTSLHVHPFSFFPINSPPRAAQRYE